MITDDIPAAPDAGAPAEQIVPTALLALDGAEPAEGDEVEFKVRGIINRNEGGKSFVKITALNDQPLPDAAAPEKPAEPNEDDVRDAAEKADEEAYNT
jgi:hypothetical protein